MSTGAWLHTQFDRFLNLFRDPPAVLPAKPGRWMDLVTREERGDPAFDWYSVDPDVVYPAVIRYIREILAGSEVPPRVVTMYLAPARVLPADVWDIAQVHLRSHASRREERSEALELVRLVFTALLREENRRPIGLHILSTTEETWKL